MKLYGAIDLHSTNNVTVVIDEQDRVVYQKRLPNDLALILNELSVYQSELHGIVVESTYNWYWLVDGLMEQGYKVHLANTARSNNTTGSNTPTIIRTRAGWRTCCAWECCPRAISIPEPIGPCAIYYASEASWCARERRIC